MQDQNWDDMRFLLATARAGTFAAAAVATGVNESTVARRVARAERAASAPLFLRSAGRLALTAAGEAVCAEAEAMEEAHRRARGEASAAHAGALGRVRITAAAVIANHALAPASGALAKTHPSLEVELVADANDLSVIDREVDIALRLARPVAEARAMARRLIDLPYRAYVAANAEMSVPWITYSARMAHVPQKDWTAEAAKAAGEDLSRLAVTDAETLLAAMRAGWGKGYLPTFIGDREPALQPLEVAERRTRELWLIVHPKHRAFPRMRAATAWIEEVIKPLARM